MRRADRLRRQYRPRRVRVLLVGESPPASGRHFYDANSGLYRAVRDTFAATQPSIDGRDFRERFRDHGWFLCDLSDRPVNRLRPAKRQAAHALGINRLAGVLRRWRPQAVVVVVTAVGRHVRRAIRQAKWAGTYCEVPYPGRWARSRKHFTQRFGAFVATWFRGTGPFPVLGGDTMPREGEALSAHDDRGTGL